MNKTDITSEADWEYLLRVCREEAPDFDAKAARYSRFLDWLVKYHLTWVCRFDKLENRLMWIWATID